MLMNQRTERWVNPSRVPLGSQIKTKKRTTGLDQERPLEPLLQVQSLNYPLVLNRHLIDQLKGQNLISLVTRTAKQTTRDAEHLQEEWKGEQPPDSLLNEEENVSDDYIVRFNLEGKLMHLFITIIFNIKRSVVFSANPSIKLCTPTRLTCFMEHILNSSFVHCCLIKYDEG